jgi:hypothetical protein
MANPNDIDVAASGVAALSICESLLLALSDLKLMNEKEVLGVVSDAADAHRFAAGSPGDTAIHLSVANILDGIIASGNSVRRR